MPSFLAARKMAPGFRIALNLTDIKRLLAVYRFSYKKSNFFSCGSAVFIFWTINFFEPETVFKMLLSSLILYYFQWEVKNCNTVYIFVILDFFFLFHEGRKLLRF